MPDVYVAELLIDDSIEAKLRGKGPPLTGGEVREAVVFAQMP